MIALDISSSFYFNSILLNPKLDPWDDFEENDSSMDFYLIVFLVDGFVIDGSIILPFDYALG